MSTPAVRDLRTKTRMRKYTEVPISTVRAINKAAPLYGSIGRALQVATEILIRQKRPVAIKYRIQKDGVRIAASYKLLPRTISLIDRLAPVYGTRGNVLVACEEVLRDAV